MPLTIDLLGVAVITGAGSGIGQAVARTFALAGCSSLALLDLNTDGLEATKSEVLSLGSSANINVQVYTCDISSSDSVESTFKSIHDHFGRIDYSIHAAGILGSRGSSADITIEDFDKLNSINYRGLFLCSRAALAVMRNQSLNSEAYGDATDKLPPHRGQRGSIVNIASAAALSPMRTAPIYNASKAAVVGLTRADALDLAPDRVRINCVCPGPIDTPMINSTPESKAAVQANTVDRNTPMKRFGDPDEIADAVAFLCSSRASYVTGAAWAIDGGYVAGK